MSDTILSKIEGGVMTIKLNRPDVYNAFNREMALALQVALDEAMRTDAVRAVLLYSEGKAFCSGQDLKEALDPEAPNIQKIVHGHYNPIITKMRVMEKPIVCAVNGVAAGAGANIALAADLVLAAERASFIQAFSKIGLIPDSGGTWMLPRLVGMQRASALMMLAEPVSATEAQAMGMIYKVFGDDILMEEAMKICRKLAEMPTAALGYTKLALNASGNNTLEQQLELEEQYQGACGDTNDFMEGIAAFVDKRKPTFTGK